MVTLSEAPSNLANDSVNVAEKSVNVPDADIGIVFAGFLGSFGPMRPFFLLGLLATSLLAQDQQPQPGGWQIDSIDAQTQPYIPSDAPAPSSYETDPGVQAPAAPEVDPKGAVAAMMAIDPKYVEGIVVVTGRGGLPEPAQWIVVARDTNDLGVLHKITVADGQVIADVQSLNAYESFRQDVNINPEAVQVDSGQAFFIAQPVAAANQKIIGHVDYALTVRGKDSAPIWTLNCFDINGGYLGKVVILATTGDVLDTPGFRQRPAVQPN